MNTATAFAAPAPIDDDLEPAGEEELTQAEKGSDRYLDAMCEELVHWCITRRHYANLGVQISPIGKLGKSRHPPRPGGADADCSAEMSALYVALSLWPAESLGRQVFVRHYFVRERVKVASARLKIGRQHWYTLLREFRRQLYAASQRVLDMNERELAALPHRHAGGR